MGLTSKESTGAMQPKIGEEPALGDIIENLATEARRTHQSKPQTRHRFTRPATGSTT